MLGWERSEGLSGFDGHRCLKSGPGVWTRISRQRMLADEAWDNATTVESLHMGKHVVKQREDGFERDAAAYRQAGWARENGVL